MDKIDIHGAIVERTENIKYEDDKYFFDFFLILIHKYI